MMSTLMKQTLYVECNDKQTINAETIGKDPERALRVLISGGCVDRSSHVHEVLRRVVPTRDNRLRRLLYYYFETICNSEAFVVCINTIANDLASPNEYIRGIALRFVRVMSNSDHVTALLGRMRTNLNNKSVHVRMNAVASVAEIARRYDVDVEEELLGVFDREKREDVLCVLINAMSELGISLETAEQTALGGSYGDELLLTLIERGSLQFVKSLMESKVASSSGINNNEQICSDRNFGNISSDVVYRAALRLLRSGQSDAAIQKIVISTLGRDMRDRREFVAYAGLMKEQTDELLELLDWQEIDFARAIGRRAIELATTQMAVEIAKRLADLFLQADGGGERKRLFRVVILELAEELYNRHGVVDIKLSYAVLDAVLDGTDAELGFQGLRLLRVCGIDSVGAIRLVDRLFSLVYGKLFRLALEVVTAHATEALFERLLDMALAWMHSCAGMLGHSGIYAGTALAVAIAEMHQPEWALKHGTKAIAVLVALLHPKQDVWIDFSSRATISICLRRIQKEISSGEMVDNKPEERVSIDNKPEEKVSIDNKPEEKVSIVDNKPEEKVSIVDNKQGERVSIDNKPGEITRNESKEIELADNEANTEPFLYESHVSQPIDVLEPLQFPFFKTEFKNLRFEWPKPVVHRTNVQLSGLGEPFYAEADVIYDHFSVTIDLLLVNQTDAYLQDIVVDYVSSPNIRMAGRETAEVLTMRARSMRTLRYIFYFCGPATSFISAAILYRRPGRNDSYVYHVQNLAEISFGISTFLRPACVVFADEWRNLEWENLYAVTLDCANRTEPLEHLFARLIGAISARVCDKFVVSNYLVANLAAHVANSTLLLANVCMSVANTVIVEIRLRSSSEEIVKNVKDLCSAVFKESV